MHAAFLHSVEQRQNSWDSWERISYWHSRHLDAMRMTTQSKTPKTEPVKDRSKEKICGIEVSFMQESKLCMKYQSNQCELESGHPNPHGKSSLSHSCAFCLFKSKDVADHSAQCPVLSRKSKSEGFWVGCQGRELVHPVRCFPPLLMLTVLHRILLLFMKISWMTLAVPSICLAILLASIALSLVFLEVWRHYPYLYLTTARMRFFCHPQNQAYLPAWAWACALEAFPQIQSQTTSTLAHNAARLPIWILAFMRFSPLSCLYLGSSITADPVLRLAWWICGLPG